jgi:hypothetical protein
VSRRFCFATGLKAVTEATLTAIANSNEVDEEVDIFGAVFEFGETY